MTLTPDMLQPSWYAPGVLGVPLQAWMWSRSMLAIRELEKKLPPESAVVHTLGATSIPAARTHMADTMMADRKYQWLCFCDSDAVPEPNALLRLLERMTKTGPAIIGAAYFHRTEPYNLVVEKLPGAEDPAKGQEELYEASAIGTHFAVIDRRIFEDISTSFLYHPEQKGIGEDWEFCHRARAAGYKVYLDCSFTVGHMAVMNVK